MSSSIPVVNHIHDIAHPVQCSYHLAGMPDVDVPQEARIIFWDFEGVKDIREQCSLGGLLAISLQHEIIEAILQRFG